MHSDTITHAARHAAAVACAFLIEIIQAMPAGPHDNIIAVVTSARDVLLESSSSSSSSSPASPQPTPPSPASTLETLTLHLRSWGDSASPVAINATLSSLAICHHIITTQNVTSQLCASLLVCIGLSRLNLTLPSVPIDPSARFRVKAFNLRSSCSEIQTLSAGTLAASAAVTALISGSLSRSLSVAARSISSSAAAAARLEVQRPVLDAFEPLFSDLSSVATSLCSIDRISQVCPIILTQVCALSQTTQHNTQTKRLVPFNIVSPTDRRVQRS